MFLIHNFENTESWEDKAETHKRQAIASWHRPHLFIFAPHFSAFTINKLQRLPLSKFLTLPLREMFASWYYQFVHIHVFMGIHETINNNQEDLKH